MIFWENSSFFVTQKFPFIIHEIFLKCLWKQKILCLKDFYVILSDLYTQIFRIYIYSQIFLENLWKQKILYSNDFWTVSSYFATQIFCFYIFAKKFWENYEHRYIAIKWLLNNFWLFCYSDLSLSKIFYLNDFFEKLDGNLRNPEILGGAILLLA